MYIQTTPAQITDMIQNKTLQELKAVKNKIVHAQRLTTQMVQDLLAQGGYQTVVMDDNGKPMVETTNKKIAEGDWLLTQKLEGYDNCYIVGDAKFATLYDQYDEVGHYKPKGGVRTVYQLPAGMNLEFEAPWGGQMKIRSGGVLVADGDKYYGINPEEFKATHSVVEA